jgi:hypothetical protein
MLQIFSPLDYGDRNADFRVSYLLAVDVISHVTEIRSQVRVRQIRRLLFPHVTGIVLIL